MYKQSVIKQDLIWSKQTTLFPQFIFCKIRIPDNWMTQLTFTHAISGTITICSNWNSLYILKTYLNIPAGKWPITHTHTATTIWIDNYYHLLWFNWKCRTIVNQIKSILAYQRMYWITSNGCYTILCLVFIRYFFLFN